MRLMNWLKVFVLVMSLVCLVGCEITNNPTDVEIEKAKNFDFFNEHGYVTEKSIKYFEEQPAEYTETSKKIVASASEGKPYYYICIARNSNGTDNTCLSGVSRSVYEMIEVGDTLPLRIVITEKSLYEIEGSAIDMQADLDDGEWYVVIEDFGEINVYPVTPETYYGKDKDGRRLVEIGRRYPLPLPPELEKFDIPVQ